MQPAVVILLAGRWLANRMGDFGDSCSSRLQIESEDRFSVRSVTTAGGIPGSRSAANSALPLFQAPPFWRINAATRRPMI